MLVCVLEVWRAHSHDQVPGEKAKVAMLVEFRYFERPRSKDASTPLSNGYQTFAADCCHICWLCCPWQTLLTSLTVAKISASRPDDIVTQVEHMLPATQIRSCAVLQGTVIFWKTSTTAVKGNPHTILQLSAMGRAAR